MYDSRSELTDYRRDNAWFQLRKEQKIETEYVSENSELNGEIFQRTSRVTTGVTTGDSARNLIFRGPTWFLVRK